MHQCCAGRPVATGSCGAQEGLALPKRGRRPRGAGTARLGKVVGAERQKALEPSVVWRNKQCQPGTSPALAKA